MNIGQRIKQRRLELNYSVEEVATLLGKNKATVYRYENNEIENLPTTVLEPLAKVLETSPAFLMGWTDNDYEIKTIAAHHDGEWTKEELEEIEQFKNFVRMRRGNK